MRIRKMLVIAGILTITMTGCNASNKDGSGDKKAETTPKDKVQAEIQKEVDALNQKEGDQAGKEEYDMPLTDEGKQKAKAEAEKVAASYHDVYMDARKQGKTTGMVEDSIIEGILNAAAATGEPVCEDSGEYNLKNYTLAKEALTKIAEGQEASFVINQITIGSGGLYRLEFEYKSGEMTAVQTAGTYSEDGDFEIQYIRKSAVRDYEYTKQGRFLYEIVMQNGTELSNGSSIIRIDPLDEACMRYTREIMWPIGYQGTNVFLTDWDVKDIKDLDLNDTFEAFYYLANRKPMENEDFANGVAKGEFESMMTSYLAISKEQVEKSAVYDKKSNRYAFKHLGCGNYSPDMWGVPEPEVISYKENNDKSITLTVQAVWMGKKEEQAFVHEVSVRPMEDGRFLLLGNKIVPSNDNDVPKYIHRTK